MPVPTLYHGTDARILRMSHDEIDAFRQDILYALDYLWVFFSPFQDGTRDIELLKAPLKYDTDPALFSRISLALNINKHRLDGHSGWQYDGLHLTNCEELAWHYAKRAFHFGEIGMIAYQFILAARMIRFKGWAPNEKVLSTIQKITEFAEGNPEPIVVVLDGLDIKGLRGEGGKKLKEGYASRAFIYTGQIDITDKPRLLSPTPDLQMENMLEFRSGELVLAKW